MDNQFRKKPVVIEAVQWPGNKFDSTPPQWFQDAMYRTPGAPGFLMRWGDELIIDTLEGQMRAAPGDWIIQGIKGEIYPCKPDIFEATYERAITAGTPAKGGIDADAAFWTKAEAWANARPGKDGLKAGDALSAYVETYAAALAERAASNPASPTTGACAASPAPVAAIADDELSHKVLSAIYHACQRGGSPEQLHVAIMPDVRAALSSAPMAQAEPGNDEQVFDFKLELAELASAFRHAKMGEEARTAYEALFTFVMKSAATPAVPAAPSERDADQLNAAIQRAAGDLPAGHMIRVEVENGAGWVEWEDDEGFVQFVDSDEGSLAERVIAAIESANAHADSAAAPAAPIERENGQ